MSSRLADPCSHSSSSCSSSSSSSSLIDSKSALKSKYAIGIDLGTTYSCVSVYREGQVEIIANEVGNRTIPSVVAFSDGRRLVGEAAKNQAAMNPKNTIFGVKRLIGRYFSDDIVQQDMKLWPFQVVESKKDGRPLIQVEEKSYYPQEISAMILSKLKQIAESYLGETVNQAVITCPAYFNENQRQATKDAGQIAGLEVMRILNEPTASALAYGFEQMKEQRDKEMKDCKESKEAKQEEKNKTVFVFDLGGGTFDVSIVSMLNGTFEVKGISGDTHLGGDDFDNEMVRYSLQQFVTRHPTYSYSLIEQDSRAIRRLRTACERAKRTLSTQVDATIEIESFYNGHDLEVSISRAKFNQICFNLYEACKQPMKRALLDAHLRIDQIDEIILVGGCTRIPYIQQMVQEFFNGKRPVSSINPDEAVSYGAAIEAAVLNGQMDDVNHPSSCSIVLIDVIPLSLGLSSANGEMVQLIPKGTSIPCEKKSIFTTSRDHQCEVSIRVFEGNRPRVRDNHRLGSFILEGIRDTMAGEPQIEVTFRVDTNGLLQVTCQDLENKALKKMTIRNDQHSLTREEIEQKQGEEEKEQEKDQEYKKRYDLLHRIQSCLKEKDLPWDAEGKEKGYLDEWKNMIDLNERSDEDWKELAVRFQAMTDRWSKCIADKIHASSSASLSSSSASLLSSSSSSASASVSLSENNKDLKQHVKTNTDSTIRMDELD